MHKGAEEPAVDPTKIIFATEGLHATRVDTVIVLSLWLAVVGCLVWFASSRSDRREGQKRRKQRGGAEPGASALAQQAKDTSASHSSRTKG